MWNVYSIHIIRNREDEVHNQWQLDMYSLAVEKICTKYVSSKLIIFSDNIPFISFSYEKSCPSKKYYWLTSDHHQASFLILRAFKRIN